MDTPLDDLDKILDASECDHCGGWGCEECEENEYCSICDGLNGDHELECPENKSPFSLLCREGYD